jgi:hypothetical protein
VADDNRYTASEQKAPPPIGRRAVISRGALERALIIAVIVWVGLPFLWQLLSIVMPFIFAVLGLLVVSKVIVGKFGA